MHYLLALLLMVSLSACGKNPFVDISNMNKNTGRLANEFEHDRKYMEGVNTEIKRMADSVVSLQTFFATLEKFFNSLMATLNNPAAKPVEVPNSISGTSLETIKTEDPIPPKNDEFNF